jgi:hypothetical protein
MRFFTILLFLIGVSSCNDGDFETLSFNFDSTVQSCGEYVLYKTSPEKTEALILILDSTDIIDEEGTKSIAISADKVKYRVFDKNVGSDYFCATIPPLTPTVIYEWTAIAGSLNKIEIVTTKNLDESTGEITGYKHQIDLVNLILENEGKQEVFENFNFGSFDTTVSKKVQ